MRQGLRARILCTGLLVSMILIAQPLLALCGNCARNGGVLACYAYSDSNNDCFTIRCWVEGDDIGFPQRGYCCYDEMACAF